MVNKHTNIQGQKVIVSCDDFLESYADWLLVIIDKMFKDNVNLRDGERFNCGWSFFTFRRNEKGDLVVVAPDIANNPFMDETEDLSDAFYIQSEQAQFALNEGVEPVFTSFQDKIIHLKGCLRERDLFMTRAEPAINSGDSGWYIGVKDFNQANKPPSKADLEAVYAFELTKLRPELLSVLSLPPGYVVTFKNDAIEFVGHD